MIKEKLMKALKTAAADYNDGMGANMAVACAAQAWDFNEKQAERLVEMFNTAAALKKQKDDGDPTGSCELATKEAVAKILLDECKPVKKASHEVIHDYSFYGSDPEKTNLTIESRKSGIHQVVKSASASEEGVPDGLDLSQGSLFKIINEKIDLLKSAADAAGEVAFALRAAVDSDSKAIAKAIEDPYATSDLADMFKSACGDDKVIKSVSSYSTRLSDSNGGRFSRMNVFDSSPVEDLLKTAEEIGKNMSLIKEYESRKEFYMSKAAEALNCLKDAVGIKDEEKKSSVADFFKAGSATAKMSFMRPADSKKVESGSCSNDEPNGRGNLLAKIASIMSGSEVSPEDVGMVLDELEKDAAPAARPGILAAVSVPSGETIDSLASGKSIPEERRLLLNVRRSIILSDLLTNDPIIRDADPNTVVEAYKTMVMTSPRVSLDKAQARAFLRNAVNSVAISPADAKVIADVDRGVALSNVERLTALDSSIKDSNVAS